MEGMEGIKLVTMGIEAGVTLAHESKFTALQKSPCPTADTIAKLPDSTFATGFHFF
jgi:hypothetical protein